MCKGWAANLRLQTVGRRKVGAFHPRFLKSSGPPHAWQGRRENEKPRPEDEVRAG
jgi:hypothetical protein